MSKYEGKVQKGKEAYENSNINCMREIESSHRAHDTLIDSQLLTVLVCQVRSGPVSFDDLRQSYFHWPDNAWKN